jgi:hypothetical protein
MVFPSWLRHGAVMIVMAGLLGLGVGCHHSGGTNGSVTVSGTVSFNRPTVTYATEEGPGSVATTGAFNVSRCVLVRVFQLVYDLDQNGNLHQNWRLSGSTTTDVDGYYAIGDNIYEGYPTFVEVESIFEEFGGHSSMLQILADPNGINSSLPEPQRPIWAYRVGLDGVPRNTSDTNVVAPDNTVIPPSYQIPVITGNTTVNVNVGLTDSWVATLPNWWVPGSVTNATSKYQQAQPSDYQPVGGRVMAIMDNAYVISYYYGDPTPSQVVGGVLDLHYYPGRTEAARSFVIYDTRRTPLSYDGTKSHYFGSVAAGPTFDDAWDEKAIYPILARNFLYSQARTALFPTGTSSLSSLSPDLAVVDGLGDAMAAILTVSPYVTDTTAATPFVLRDIRSAPTAGPILPDNPAIASPANLAALAWNLSLKGSASPILPPGTPAQWATLDPFAMVRFYTLIYPTSSYEGANGTVTPQTDINSIYAQVGRLLEGKQSQEPVDLARDFSNLSLIGLLEPFNIFWPADATLPNITDWPFLATDLNPTLVSPGPASAAMTIPFTMANAQQLTDPLTGASVFPNESQGEVAYARLALFYDTAYQLSVTSSAPLPVGTSIEAVVDGQIGNPYLFSAGSAPITLTLTGDARDSTNPVVHFIRFRLINPNLPAAPDFTATIQLTRTGNP